MKEAHFIFNPIGDNNWCKLHGYPMSRCALFRKHYSQAELSLVGRCRSRKIKQRWKNRIGGCKNE